jgi:YwiC-like protein
MATTSFTQTYIQKHIALPSDHGSWVFVLSPLLIGIFAGRRFTLASAFLVVAVMGVFLLRQPVTMMVKALSGRRSRRDLPPAGLWTGVYTAISGLAGIGLALQGFDYLLILVLPGILVFIWHLALVSRRAERRQAGVEIIGSGVLALAAPAAYWVGKGQPDPSGWWLFGLTWFQSAASIVYAYLRLEQRALPQVPDLRTRLLMGHRALLYTSFNLAATVVLAAIGILPRLIFIPYSVQWIESIVGTLRPAVGVKPTLIGLRQLSVSTLFTVLFILAWRI